MATVGVKGLSYRCRIAPYHISSGDKTSFEVSRLGIDSLTKVGKLSDCHDDTA